MYILQDMSNIQFIAILLFIAKITLKGYVISTKFDIISTNKNKHSFSENRMRTQSIVRDRFK